MYWGSGSVCNLGHCPCAEQCCSMSMCLLGEVHSVSESLPLDKSVRVFPLLRTTRGWSWCLLLFRVQLTWSCGLSLNNSKAPRCCRGGRETHGGNETLGEGGERPTGQTPGFCGSAPRWVFQHPLVLHAGKALMFYTDRELAESHGMADLLWRGGGGGAEHAPGPADFPAVLL